MANGALGSFFSAIENLKRKARRNIADISERPEDWAQMAAARYKQDLPEQFSRPESAFDFLAGPVGGLAGVIKAKGGNWLPGSVESALGRLKRGTIDEADFKNAVERFGRDQALEMRANLEASPFVRKELPLNRWIEGPLTKYVKTSMATEADPVRALAEQGILHYAPEAMPRYMDDVWSARESAGFPASFGTSPLAQRWEAYADQMIRPRRLEETIRKNNPGGMTVREMVSTKPGGEWAATAPGSTAVHELSNFFKIPEELGFTHLTDELRNALNPESGLPRNLLLNPEQMQQMGMEKAVRHVASINDWRAAQKIAADQELANRAMAVREYAENNPKGLRWVELGADEELARMYKEGIPSGDAAAEAYKTKLKALEDQLKYEGDVMGHCVGGYCPDVLSGKSRIFSLRDAKGEPHVTIEVGKPNASQESVDRLIANLKNDGYTDEAIAKTVNSVYPQSDLAVPIVQIKGKQNLAPKEEYLPFVQDFVKNSPIGGQWGEVGDISNTGLRMRRDVFNPTELNYLKTKGVEPSDFLLQNEIDEYQKLFGQNKAHGGLVHSNPFGDVTPHAMLNRVIDAYNEL